MHTALLCPFIAGTVSWQAQDGSWTLTVCVRGTFSLVQGREVVLADVQEPITGDRYYGKDPRQGMHAASELIPYKPRTDVILVGSAFAADHAPVEAMIARLAVGELDKSVGVIGDRRWVEGPDGLEPSAPMPFTAMSLRHDRATRTLDNPAGFDLARAPVLGALAMPNLEGVDDSAGEGELGFGPLPPNAASRRSLLNAEGFAWAMEGLRGPVPPGFDFSFYNAAPRDQQIGLLRHGETILLENLSREHARLSVKLPSVRPKAFLVSDDTERSVEVALRCDTVWIDTDRALVALSWRGLIGLESAETRGLDMLLVAAEAKGHELRWKHIQRMLREGTSVSLDEDLLGETNPMGLRHDAVKSSSREPPTALADAAPISSLIEEVSFSESDPGIVEELSNSDFLDTPSSTTEREPMPSYGSLPGALGTIQLRRSSPIPPPEDPSGQSEAIDAEETITDYNGPGYREEFGAAEQGPLLDPGDESDTSGSA